MSDDGPILALAGGVGGAKLALGLTHALPRERLRIVVNTGDDFEHLGLHISPDLDSVMYALAGMDNQKTGWGVEGESWNFMDALGRLGGETWFSLGDRDLATHIERTRLLNAGHSLSEVTTTLSGKLGIGHSITPMSDAPVRTVVDSDEGTLPFQDYFVRRKCEPVVRGFAFDGIDAARPSRDFAAALAEPALAGVIICPSNPFVSVEPILALAGVRDALAAAAAPIVAVSPIIGGAAVKGPAAKMMRELGVDVSVMGIAEHYAGLIDGLVIDHADAAFAERIEALGVRVGAYATLMKTSDDKARLAQETISFLGSLSP